MLLNSCCLILSLRGMFFFIVFHLKFPSQKKRISTFFGIHLRKISPKTFQFFTSSTSRLFNEAAAVGNIVPCDRYIAPLIRSHSLFNGVQIKLNRDASFLRHADKSIYSSLISHSLWCKINLNNMIFELFL